MPIQNFLFKEKDAQNDHKKYTPKIQSPVYEITGENPHISELLDDKRMLFLIQKINKSNVSKLEKRFLISAAKRHIIFNFEKIAEYYAHASAEMQELMEDSALVIIDFKKAIELGFVKLNERIQSQYVEESEK